MGKSKNSTTKKGKKKKDRYVEYMKSHHDLNRLHRKYGSFKHIIVSLSVANIKLPKHSNSV
jgi:hypothetical protein